MPAVQSSGVGLQRAGSAISSASGISDSFLDKQLGELMLDMECDEPAGRQAVEPSESSKENVAVMVRCRPAASARSRLAVEVDEEQRCVRLAAPATSASGSGANRAQVREFYFDKVFSSSAQNEQVYMKSARSLMEFAFAGYNCTIFLYGQTGTGKTFTHSSLTSSSFEHLFSLIKSSNQTTRLLIRASYYEVYNEEIHDLLSNQPGRALELHESKTRGVYIKELTCFLVNNPSELDKLKRLGDRRRSTAATKMNDHSSRSHSIFSITIETTSAPTSTPTASTTTGPNQTSRATMKTNNEQLVRVGRLHLIDLAGSERQTKSGSSGARLKEASRINLSLTCLSLVIRALTDANSTHVPYRNSKLTRLLSSSLGGNSKTLLIACIAPEESNSDETLNTLRFASRTKRIKNEAKINEDPKDALLRKYRRQVSDLRRKLRQQQQMGDTPSDASQLGGSGEEEENGSEMSRQQLELLKAKIMVGGENLLDKVELHERLLEASRAEIEEKRTREAKLRRQLIEKRNKLEQVKQSKGSLDVQRQQLELRLDRAIQLLKRTKLEQRDLASEHEQLKDSLLQGIKSTSKDIKFVDCIIEDFVPREHLDLINAYSQYDDESEEWQIKYIAMSGNNIARTSRPPPSQPDNPSSSANSATTNSSSGNANNNQDIPRLGNKRQKHTNASTRLDPYVRL